MKYSELEKSLKKDCPNLPDKFWEFPMPRIAVIMAENYFREKKDNDLLKEYLKALHTKGFYSFEKE